MSNPVTRQQSDENSDESSDMALATQTMIQQTQKLKAQTDEQMAACQAVLESHERTCAMLDTAQGAGSDEC